MIWASMNLSVIPDEYDSPWKDALEHAFPEFMAFYFPQAHSEIDWVRGHEFKNTELRQVVRDAELGKRYADALVKVTLKSGEERRSTSTSKCKVNATAALLGACSLTTIGSMTAMPPPSPAWPCLPTMKRAGSSATSVMKSSAVASVLNFRSSSSWIAPIASHNWTKILTRSPSSLPRIYAHDKPGATRTRATRKSVPSYPCSTAKDGTGNAFLTCSLCSTE